MENYVFSFWGVLPYLLIVCIIVYLNICHVGGKKNTYFLYLILLIFSAVRFGVGYDYFSYQSLILFKESTEFDRIEPIAKFLMNLSHISHYQLFFIVTSILVIYPVYYVSKRYSVNPLLSLSTYFLFPILYLESLSTVRNSVAYSLCFIAYFCFVEKKYLFAVALFLLSIGFHYSALFAIFILIPYFTRISPRILLIVYLFSFFASNFILNLIMSLAPNNLIIIKLIQYAFEESEGGDKLSIILNFMAFVVLYFWNKIPRYNRVTTINFALFVIGCILWNIFSFDVSLRLRLSSYFLIFAVLVVPEVISFMHFRKKQSLLVALLFLITFFMSSMYIQISYYKQTANKVSSIPYQTIFWGKEYRNLN